jgi:hypothetical protein
MTTTPDCCFYHRTGADAGAPCAPVACTTTTVRRLAILAGSKAEVARACNVSLRTVGYWRSGKTDKVPFAAVLVLASLCGCPIDQVRP